jgi:hypothetical protein
VLGLRHGRSDLKIEAPPARIADGIAPPIPR